MILYNPDADILLAQRLGQGAGGFLGRNNYYTSTIFAWVESDASDGTIFIIDTRDLTPTGWIRL